ncbi:MAG TPA: hypothetical protein VF476_03215, partial [Chitinophagaceae bacterium]
MENEQKKTPDDLSTMVSCLRKARKDGFTVDFLVDQNAIKAPDARKMYRPEEVKVASFYRFEGASDPSDNAILYLLETRDGKRGTLVDAYGVYADPQVSSFIDKIKNITRSHGTQARLNIFRIPMILAIFSLFFVLLGVVLKSPDKALEPFTTSTALILAVIYTIWIIAEVISAKHLLFYQRMFWLILTISVPFFGALIY